MSDQNATENAPDTATPANGEKSWLDRLPPAPRLWGSIAIAMALALGCYAVYEAFGASSVTVAFLFILPTCLSAFIAIVGRSAERWSGNEIWWIPALVTAVPLAFGAALFEEGIICLVMLAPFWFGGAMLGVLPVHYRRTRTVRIRPDIFGAQTLLLLPVMAMLVEAQIPEPVETRVVTRHIDVGAAPDRTWDALLTIPAISPDEGVMTLTHSLLRVPRPVAATLTGQGVGAVREGRWEGGIRFEERIIVWQPGRELRWRYAFPDPSIHLRTDRHIAPRGRHLSVEDGGYRLTPLAGGGTRITLWTRYRLTSHVNAYAGAWGDWMLADVQDNILAIAAGRVDALRGGREK